MELYKLEQLFYTLVYNSNNPKLFDYLNDDSIMCVNKTCISHNKGALLKLLHKFIKEYNLLPFIELYIK